MPRRLPDHANLEHLKNQAKSLQHAVRHGDTEALARFENTTRASRRCPTTHPKSTRCKRSDAQLVVAREYGFTSWPKLREHIAVVEAYTRRRHLAPADSDPDRRAQADEFLRLACLRYGGDRSADRERARDAP